MADEARLNELLDLVEQARSEGDKATEAKAVAAYKRESSPKTYRMEDTVPGLGGKLYNPDGTEYTPAKSAPTPTSDRWADKLADVGNNLGISPITDPLIGGAEAGLSGVTNLFGKFMGGTASVGQLAITPWMDPNRQSGPADTARGIEDYFTYKPGRSGQDLLSPVARGAEQVMLNTPDNPSSQTLVPAFANLVSSLSPVKASITGGVRALERIPVGKTAIEKPPIPTTEQLRTASSAAYDASEKAGVVLNPESTLRVVDMMQRVADSENLGKLPPKIKEASDILTQRLEAGKPLTLKDADKVRQLINDAKKSTDAADQRLAGIIQGEYDQYLGNLGHEDVIAGNKDAGLSALIEARDLFKRSKNSQMLDDMEHDAGLTGSTNYTQAGVELAMRREFLRLAKNDREMRKLTPEQRTAVEKVAAPGKGANTLRNIGKFDPTRGGVPAFMASLLGGGGGAAVAGPAGAVMGPALIGTAAHLANRGAARITRNNVAGAREALVGRGLPTGLLAKDTPAPTAAGSQGLLGEAATPLARSAADIQAAIQRLSVRVRFELANEDASSPKVQQSIAELQSLQRELAATQANP